MSTEAVETSAPESELYSYYKSHDRKPLGSLSNAEDLEAAITSIKRILKSPEAQKIIPVVIDASESGVNGREWEVSLAPPPDVSKSALNKYAKEVDSYDWKELPVVAKILEEYSSAAPNTPYKSHRLLEIILTAVHHISIHLYFTHNPPPEISPTDMLPPPPYPVIAHGQYYASKPWKQIYDKKSVGFWAEALIFGGVVYFDREHAGDTEDYAGIWLHGLPHAHTESLWHVPDEVVQKALDEAGKPRKADEESVLPFDISAAQEPPLLLLQEAEEKHGIYRDPHLANEGTYTGDESLDFGMTAEDFEEWQKSKGKA